MKNSSIIVLLVATFVALMAGGNVAGFSAGLFMQAVSSEFHWSRSIFSVGIFSAMILGATLLPFAGKLADRYGPRRVLLAAIAVFSAFTALLSLLNGALVQFFLLFIPFTAASIILSPAIYCRVVAGWTDRRRGLALAAALSGNALGAVVISLFGSLAIQRYGWRYAYIFLAIYVFLLPSIAVYFFIKDPPGFDRRNHALSKVAVPGLTLREAARTRVFWILVSVLFLNGMGVYGLNTHAVPMLLDRGVSRINAATVLSAMGMAQLGGRLVSGALLDSTRTGRIAAAFFFTSAIGLALLALGGTHQTLLVAGAILIGMGLGADAELSAFFVGRYFGLKAYATIFGVAIGCLLIGDAFGPLMFGLSYDLLGSYVPALKAAVIIIILSAAGGLLLGPYVYTVRGAKAFQANESEPELEQLAAQRPR
jgi:MFS family permease